MLKQWQKFGYTSKIVWPSHRRTKPESIGVNTDLILLSARLLIHEGIFS